MLGDGSVHFNKMQMMKLGKKKGKRNKDMKIESVMKLSRSFWQPNWNLLIFLYVNCINTKTRGSRDLTLELDKCPICKF